MTDDDDTDDDDQEAAHLILQVLRALPDGYKIPPKAWTLIPKAARDTFLEEQAKILVKLDDGTADGKVDGKADGKALPKQYGGAGKDDTHARNTNLLTSVADILTAPDDSNSDSDGSMTSQEEALVTLLRSCKASHNASRYICMVKTVPTITRTIYINIDPTRVCSLLSKLSKREAVSLSNGGSDMGLLGDEWHIVGYTRRYANIVSFDEFLARKGNLPIVIAIMKCTPLGGKQPILIQHNEGVYNKGSGTTILSEFQMCSRGCIIDSTYRGHHGADGKPGTQHIVTPDVNGEPGFTIPLTLCDALMTFPISLPTAKDLEIIPTVTLDDVTLNAVTLDETLPPTVMLDEMSPPTVTLDELSPPTVMFDPPLHPNTPLAAPPNPDSTSDAQPTLDDTTEIFHDADTFHTSLLEGSPDPAAHDFTDDNHDPDNDKPPNLGRQPLSIDQGISRQRK